MHPFMTMLGSSVCSYTEYHKIHKVYLELTTNRKDRQRYLCKHRARMHLVTVHIMELK
jgi:hypothetical protein